MEPFIPQPENKMYSSPRRTYAHLTSNSYFWLVPLFAVKRSSKLMLLWCIQKAPHWKPSAHSTRSLSQRSVTVSSCWPVLRYFTKRVIRVATINQEGIEWPLGSPCLQAFRSWLLNHTDHTAFCGAWNPHCKNAEAKSRQIDISLAPPDWHYIYFADIGLRMTRLRMLGALVTFSNPCNHSGVSQQVRILPKWNPNLDKDSNNRKKSTSCYAWLVSMLREPNNTVLLLLFWDILENWVW